MTRTLRLIAAHWRAAVIELVRLPGYFFPTMILPVMLYAFFGIPASDDARSANLILASFTTFAVFGVVFFQFGVGIAQSRETSWEGYLRTLPAGPVAALRRPGVGGVEFRRSGRRFARYPSPFSMTAPPWGPRAVASASSRLLSPARCPFGFFGIALGYWVTPKAAIPVANLLYLPLSYAGGLWLPPDALPAPVADLSRYLPTRHFAELAWAAVMDQPWALANWLWLFAYTGGFAALAIHRISPRRGPTLQLNRPIGARVTKPGVNLSFSAFGRKMPLAHVPPRQRLRRPGRAAGSGAALFLPDSEPQVAPVRSGNVVGLVPPAAARNHRFARAKSACAPSPLNISPRANCASSWP